MSRPIHFPLLTTTSAMQTPNIQTLFDSPAKDYKLIAKCGKSIDVHKCVLCMTSEFFRGLFTTKDMKDENEMKTDIDYNDLMKIVKWMYGFSYNPTENEYLSYDGVVDEGVYNAADKFLIDELLNWAYYISINDKYLLRYHNIVSGKQEMNLMEQRGFEDIKMYVRAYIATRATIVTGSVVNITYKYSANDNILYDLSIDVLDKWFESKYRKNSEEDMVLFLDKYQQLHPELEQEIRDKLASKIKLCGLKNKLEFSTKYNIPIPHDLMKSPSVHSPTYYFVLNKCIIGEKPVYKYQLSSSTWIVHPYYSESIQLSSLFTSSDIDALNQLRNIPALLEYLLARS